MSAARRILLVAKEVVVSDGLRGVVDDAEIVVVAPALIDRLRYWTSDDGRARSAAAERLDRSLGALRSCGVDARGYVGDADPLQAMDDALRLFGADEILVATHVRGRSNWRTRDVVARARSRFALPVLDLPVAAVA
jgi:hypothetical protein